jgi:pimeloyl-ACP methyl ester carboxylesterase
MQSLLDSERNAQMLRLISSRTRTARTWLAVIAAALLLGAAAQPGLAAAAAAPKPTIVLVHGSYADASSWSAVIPALQKRGYHVVATANPLRGLPEDSAYLKSTLAAIKGPVVLVGHSYGGMVISNAATGNPNVKALVYIAAFAPLQGETLQQLISHAPGSLLAPSALDVDTYHTPDGRVLPEATVKPQLFHKILAGDLPVAATAVAAASQRPTALSTLTDPAGAPAWATIPSWYLVAGADKAVGTANERFMARRMHATTVEAKGASHIVMLSQPATVTRLILDAATGRR